MSICERCGLRPADGTFTDAERNPAVQMALCERCMAVVSIALTFEDARAEGEAIPDDLTDEELFAVSGAIAGAMLDEFDGVSLAKFETDYAADESTLTALAVVIKRNTRLAGRPLTPEQADFVRRFHPDAT